MGRIIYSDGRTCLTTTAFRYKLTAPDGTLVKDWTTGATWTEEPAGTYYLDDEDAVAGTVYAVEPASGEVGGVGQVPWGEPLATDDSRLDYLDAAVSDPKTLTEAYDHAKDDVLTPLQALDGKVDAIDFPPPDDGVAITQATLGTDGDPLGRVMPYGRITAYLGTVPHYQFDADADGDYAYTLPAGSAWTLVARRAGYRTMTTEVTT